MKALTNSELAKALNVNPGESKTFYFGNNIFCPGRYVSGYNFKGVRLTERNNEKTSAAFIYDFTMSSGKIEDRFIEWNQVSAKIKKQAMKELNLFD